MRRHGSDLSNLKGNAETRIRLEAVNCQMGLQNFLLAGHQELIDGLFISRYYFRRQLEGHNCNLLIVLTYSFK